jgi:hypothetical protein
MAGRFTQTTLALGTMAGLSFSAQEKFWDFVDISLENVRKIAKEGAAADQSGNTGYETAFRQ